jgi:hypothetical protein
MEMKRIEVILRRHNKDMMQHFDLLKKGRVPEKNLKIFNETVRDIEGYIAQQVEEKIRIELINFVIDDGYDKIFATAMIDEYLLKHKDDGQSKNDKGTV